MSDVRATLEAFAAGELDYAELHRRLNAALAAGLSTDAAVTDLDTIRDAGGLSIGLYNVLYRAITRVADGEDTSPFAGSGAASLVGSNETDTGGPDDEPDIDAAEAGNRRADELPQMFTEPEALLEDDLPEVTAAGPEPVDPTLAERDEDAAEAGEASGAESAAEPTPLPSGRWLAQPGWAMSDEENGEADSASSPGPKEKPGGGGQAQQDDSPLPEAGDVIGGRYVIQSILGRGGMGVVFRARDRYREGAAADDVDLALKLLKPELRRHEDAERRLLLEALQGQALMHPNLVRIFDFGEADGMPYVTMELLDGESLRSAITRRTPVGFPPAEALAIISGVASGLAYLHQSGYVHSDLKPGNLYLCRGDEPKLLDFGLTRRPGRAMEPVLDGAGLPSRTPAYASPQVLAGEPPESSDDVFSLGCVAFELVTGRHPFNRLAADDAMARKVRPGRIKGIAAHQRRAIKRALSFVPTRRFADASAFLSAMGLGDRPRGGRLAGFLPGALAGALAGILVTIAVIDPDGPLYRLLARMPAAEQHEPPATAPATPPVAAASSDIRSQRPDALSPGGTFSPGVTGEPGGRGTDIPQADAAGSGSSRSESTPGRAVDAAGRGADSGTAMPAEMSPATSADAEATPTSQSSQTAKVPPAPVLTEQPEAVAPPPQGPGRLQLDAANYRVDESSAVLIARVIRTGGSGGNVAFRWRTLPGSASADQDYIGTDWQRVELADGQAVTRLFVPLVNDGRAEPGETFFLEIADAEGGAALGSRTSAEVSIIDDDPG